MRALYFDGKNLNYTENYQKPEISLGRSIVKVILAAVCNTDREILRGYHAFQGVIGHEFIGVVEQSDRKDMIGKRVAVELNSGCGECRYCRKGLEKHCENRESLGIHRVDGCFAEYISVDSRNLREVPESLTSEQAIFTEPLAAAINIQRQAKIPPNASVAVLGGGRLGFMTAQVLALCGCDITVLDPNSEKLATFAPFAKIATESDEKYEFVVDATGSPSGIASAQKLVESGGTVVVKSTYFGNVTIDMSWFVVNEVTILGSRCGDFRPALNLLSKGYLRFPDIELYDLKDYQKAFDSRAFKSGFKF